LGSKKLKGGDERDCRRRKLARFRREVNSAG
jgi:hypothetical protein